MLLLVLLLALPLELIDGFLRAILNQITLVVNARPFGLSVGDIEYPSWVEHVAATNLSVLAQGLSPGGKRSRALGSYTLYRSSSDPPAS